MIEEARLPDPSFISELTDSQAGPALDLVDDLFQRTIPGQFEKPVQMIGHDDEGQGVRVSPVVRGFEFVNQGAGAPECMEYGPAQPGGRGYVVDAPRFRPAAQTKQVLAGAVQMPFRFHWYVT